MCIVVYIHKYLEDLNSESAGELWFLSGKYVMVDEVLNLSKEKDAGGEVWDETSLAIGN